MLDSHDMPSGFTMQLANNTKAMNHFADLPESKRIEIIEEASKIDSYDEMKSYIDSLAENKYN